MTENIDSKTGEILPTADDVRGILRPDTLAAALAAAQGEMPNAILNQTNPHFKNKYADLASIRDASIPALSKHGLAMTQLTRIEDRNLVLITRLMHTSGQCLESEYPIPLGEPQKMGSGLTYGKRYCWSAMIGIAADADDDGNTAEKVKPTDTKQAKPKPPTADEVEAGAAELDQRFNDTVPRVEKPVSLPIRQPKDGETMAQVWDEWCLSFLRKIGAADTLTAVNAWCMQNEQQIASLKKASAERHSRLTIRIEELQNAFAGAEP